MQHARCSTKGAVVGEVVTAVRVTELKLPGAEADASAGHWHRRRRLRLQQRDEVGENGGGLEDAVVPVDQDICVPDSAYKS